jgi:NAD(P)-dependent dehydrogenase (short-subunit alcohol dehydrogenase family)
VNALHVVLGGTGGVGAALVGELAARDLAVRAVSRSGRAVVEGVDAIAADVRDPRGRSRSSGFGFHDLRHFYASLLIASGANVKVVQARLRHASASTTLDTYSHLWPDQTSRPGPRSRRSWSLVRTVCGLRR